MKALFIISFILLISVLGGGVYKYSKLRDLCLKLNVPLEYIQNYRPWMEDYVMPAPLWPVRNVGGSKVAKNLLWGQDYKFGIVDNVGQLDPLKQYSNWENFTFGYPIPFFMDFDELNDFELLQAFEELPYKLRKALKEKLIGVHVVKNLGSSGLTSAVYHDGAPRTAYMLLDYELLNKPVNDWYKSKVMSAFRHKDMAKDLDSEFLIKVKLENEKGNNRKATIRTLLLHELAHVLTVGDNSHPYWDSLSFDLSKYHSFYQASWAQDKKELYLKSYPPEDRFKFYLKSEKQKLSNGRLGKSLKWLSESNFVTLYSSTSIFEDFADAFMVYVHSQVLKKPFEISLHKKDGSHLFTFKDCYTEGRCPKKLAAMKSFYESL